MATILNVRGTNGSGKTTYVRGLLGPDPWPQQYYDLTTDKLLWFTQSFAHPKRVALGDYSKKNGGCDNYPTQESISSAVIKMIEWGAKEVIFESVLASTIFSRWHDFDQQMTAAGHLYIWGIMDTPYATCLARIYERNGGKDILEWKVERKFKDVQSSTAKARAAGLIVTPIAGGNVNGTA